MILAIMAAALVMVGVLAWQFIRLYTRLRELGWQTAREKKALTAQLAHAHWLQHGILRAIGDVLLVLDSEQRILLANPAAESLLGQSLIGETLLGAIRQPELEALIQDAQMVHGETVERQIEHERRVLRACAVAWENGHDRISVLTLRDVTEMQRLERARREMVSNISHELSTPITAIGLLADTLIDHMDREKLKKVRRMASNIRREADTLTQLVQEMRDLSLIESGQMPVRLTPTDLLSMVETSVEPLRPLAENKQQTIRIEVPEDITVWADHLQIGRAIKNLVHNAVKYTQDSGQISVTASLNGEDATIAVSDNGPGITADDLPRIFERFFQADRSRQSGTGLGLAIVRHIMRAHGGQAWVESREGQGATFYITLALADVKPEAEKV